MDCQTTVERAAYRASNDSRFCSSVNARRCGRECACNRRGGRPKLCGMSRWEVLSSRYVLQLPWFKLRVDQVKTGRGVILDDYPIIESRDWVCVVTVTTEQEAVLVQQYRHGAERVTLEFVAGGVDPGEEPLAAARRELLEETGYEADEWQLLRRVSPDTTRHGNTAHIYLATGARCVADQCLEPAEDVSVVTRRLDDPQLLGELTHAVHVLSWYLAREALGG